MPSDGAGTSSKVFTSASCSKGGSEAEQAMRVGNPYEPPLAMAEPLPAASAGQLPEELIEALRQTRPWVAFLAILGFVGSGLFMLGGLALFVVGVAVKGAGKEAFP